MRVLHLVLFVFCVGFLNSGFAQENAERNHWAVWKDVSNPDTVRLEAIKQHIWANYIFTDQDSALLLNQLQFNFAQKTNQPIYVASAYNTAGIAYYVVGELDSGYFYMSKALHLNEQIGNLKGAASNRTNLASILTDMGLYQQAITYYFQSLRELEKTELFFERSQVLNNIGIVYDHMKYYDLSIDYYLKSAEMLRQANREDELVDTYINLGAAYVASDRFDQGKAYYEMAYDLAVELGDESGYASALQHLGSCYSILGENDLALEKHLEALAFYRESNIQNAVIGGLIKVSEIYRNEKKYNEALNSGTEALNLAFEDNSLYDMQRSCENMYFIYLDLANYKDALTMLEVSEGLKDSLQRIENKEAVLEQNYQYEYEKQAIIDSLEFENKSRLKTAKIREQNAQLNKEKTQRFALLGGVLALGVVAFLLFRGYRRKKADNALISDQKKEVEKQRDIAEKQRVEIDKQHKELSETHKEITDSINYAKRLQDAILPALSEIHASLPDSFILFNPKDVVSGDFYWHERISENEVLIAAADCTGHGVPGSLVSVVCSGALNRSVKEFGLTGPAEILTKTRQLVVETFAKSGEAVRDGMDIALCRIGKDSVRFCGANNPLWIVRDINHVTADQLADKNTVVTEKLALLEFAANRQPVGKDESENAFMEQEIKLHKGDSLYIFSDGFADQFGEVTGKKFKKKPFKELVLHINGNAMADQEKLLLQAFNVWKGNLEQIDDVCLIGVRV